MADKPVVHERLSVANLADGTLEPTGDVTVTVKDQKGGPYVFISTAFKKKSDDSAVVAKLEQAVLELGPFHLDDPLELILDTFSK